MKAIKNPIIIGNWKMNGLRKHLEQLVDISSKSMDIKNRDLLMCLPATLISEAAKLVGNTKLKIGGQDCSAENNGSFTGDISAEMLKDSGADYVILGHSERRDIHNEDNTIIYKKTEAAWRAGLTAIVCIGENLEEKDNNITNKILTIQLKESLPFEATGVNTIIAYEPIWAIGAYKAPSIGYIHEIMMHIRSFLRDNIKENPSSIRIVYGGSVSRSNIGSIIDVDGVDGVLVGRAAMKAEDYLSLLKEIN